MILPPFGRGLESRLGPLLYEACFSWCVRCDEVDAGHGQLGSMSGAFHQSEESDHEAPFPKCHRSAGSAIGRSVCAGAAADDEMRVGSADGCVQRVWRDRPHAAKPRQLSGDAALNKIEPYKAFDNVYYVGICWVSAWLITSPNGHVLIDTLYGPYTSQMLGNIRALGFDPKDIKLVVVTHGHFDHAGGIGQLKSELAPGTRFAMTKEGWREGAEDSVSHPRFPWKMIEPDIVLTDGQTVTGGDVAIQAFETPWSFDGHRLVRIRCP
jgi:hypothetical protein